MSVHWSVCISSFDFTTVCICFQYPCLTSGISLGCSTGSQMVLMYLDSSWVGCLVYYLSSLSEGWYVWFSLLIFSLVSGLSLSHLLPYVVPLPVLCRLFAYGLCTYVHVRALVYLYLLCTGGTFHFLYLVISSTVCFSLPSAYVSGLRLRTQIT